MLDFRQSPHCSNTGICGFQSFFCDYKDVKSLTLCGWTFELHPRPRGSGLKLNRLKELWWIDYAKERFNSDALI
ncbi:hypothetical protein V6N13_082350 [Hibiscus sabdariffa]